VVKPWVLGIGLVAVTATVAAAQTASQTEAEQIRARQRISMVEGLLERAVVNGVENVQRQFRAVTPTADGFTLTGTPSARGFRLDSYGVFFDVEVPALRPPLAWTLNYMRGNEQAALQPVLSELKTVQARITDARDRELVGQLLLRMERQYAPQTQAGIARGVSAASLGQGLVESPVQTAPQQLEDPNEVFTREVKKAILDAMLEYSGGIAIGPEEWLTVAARDNIRPDRLIPGDSSDLKTILFRVKGSDLAAFRSATITLEEARRRVEVRED
jgi:hypothetical protein